jgi:hypothetical protein
MKKTKLWKQSSLLLENPVLDYHKSNLGQKELFRCRAEEENLAQT